MLNWGIMGAGNIAHKMADALAQNSQSQLLAVASKSMQKARDFAHTFQIDHAYSYREIVADPEIDIIYIATTHNFHFENAKLALMKGKHVLVEKPFTVNATEAGELIQLARAKGLFLMEAMWTRFLPVTKEIKNRLKQGEIGKLKLINLTFGKFIAPKYAKRLKDPDLAGGVTLDMGVYPISYACFLLDEIPDKINSLSRFSDQGVDETAVYQFHFPSGLLCSISASYNLNMKTEALLYGSKGYIEVPEFYNSEGYMLHIHNESNEIGHSRKFKPEMHENGFVYQVEAVADAIGKNQTECEQMPLDETKAIMEVMDFMRAEWGLQYPFENPKH